MFSGSTSFSSNSGQSLGQGIYGFGTLLYFIGSSSFTVNLLQGVEETFNFLSQSTALTMGSNNAREYGGAVYVKASDPISYCFPDRANLAKCFFQVDGSYRIFFE